jgi:hypothetical protein
MRSQSGDSDRDELLVIQQHALLLETMWLKCGCVPALIHTFLYLADDPVAADKKAACV